MEQKKLKFIHITKTAGTSIELIGKKHGLTWGQFDKEYRPADPLSRCISQHVYPQWCSQEYLKSHDFFTIVRNPYTRILSECLYNNCSTPEELNIHLKKYLQYTTMEGGHFSEQYKYVVDKNTHILRFENLKEDFDNLMKMYGYAITLDIHANKSHNRNNLSVRDFDADSIQFIKTMYKKDFELFGYSMDPLLA